MSEFFSFFNNSVLFWSLLSCLLAQFFKIVFNFFSNGEIRFSIMFETGGMPSSHSALITGAASGIGYELGFDSPISANANIELSNPNSKPIPAVAPVIKAE